MKWAHRRSYLDGESVAVVRERNDLLPRPTKDGESVFEDCDAVSRHSNSHRWSNSDFKLGVLSATCLTLQHHLTDLTIHNATFIWYLTLPQLLIRQRDFTHLDVSISIRDLCRKCSACLVLLPFLATVVMWRDKNRKKNWTSFLWRRSLIEIETSRWIKLRCVTSNLYLFIRLMTQCYSYDMKMLIKTRQLA